MISSHVNGVYESIETLIIDLAKVVCIFGIPYIGVASGSKAMGASLWSGVKGVVSQPIQAVKKKGAKGFVTVVILQNCKI